MSKHHHCDVEGYVLPWVLVSMADIYRLHKGKKRLMVMVKHQSSTRIVRLTAHKDND